MGYWPSEACRATLTGDTEVLFERRSNPGHASELVQAGYLVSGGRARTETRTKFQDKIRMRLGGKRGGSGYHVTDHSFLTQQWAAFAGLEHIKHNEMYIALVVQE